QGKEDHEIIAEIASQVQGPSIAGAAVGGARQFLCPTEGATRPDDGPPATGFSDSEEAYLGWIGQREGMSQPVAQSRVGLGYEICARLANDEPDHEIIADIDMTVQGPSVAGPAVEGQAAISAVPLVCRPRKVPSSGAECRLWDLGGLVRPAEAA